MLRELEPEDAETERMLRNSFRWQWLTFALLLTALVLVFARPHSSGIAPLLAIAFVVALYTGFKVSYADGAVTSRYYLDALHRRWRFSLVNMLIFGLLGVRHVLEFPQKHELFALAVGIMFLLLPSVSLVMGPKGDVEEEIARLLRYRALRVGYLAALAVLAIAIVMAIYWPIALMAALAWGLFAVSAVPILTYVALDWMSDRGGDG
jgi:hypothetical protein